MDKKKLIDVWGFLKNLMKKILLIGASGNLGSSIKKSAFFLNLHTLRKKNSICSIKKKSTIF